MSKPHKTSTEWRRFLHLHGRISWRTMALAGVLVLVATWYLHVSKPRLRRSPACGVLVLVATWYLHVPMHMHCNHPPLDERVAGRSTYTCLEPPQQRACQGSVIQGDFVDVCRTPSWRPLFVHHRRELRRAECKLAHGQFAHLDAYGRCSCSLFFEGECLSAPLYCRVRHGSGAAVEYAFADGAVAQQCVCLAGYKYDVASDRCEGGDEAGGGTIASQRQLMWPDQ